MPARESGMTIHLQSWSSMLAALWLTLYSWTAFCIALLAESTAAAAASQPCWSASCRTSAGIMLCNTLQADVRSHATWLAQRPDSFETDAIKALLSAMREDSTPAAQGFRLHIAHVSSAQVLPLLAKAKAEGKAFAYSAHAPRIPRCMHRRC